MKIDVLIVEDDPSINDIIPILLDIAFPGMLKCDIAINSQSAIDKALIKKYALFMIDLMLRNSPIQGIELGKKLRKDNRGSKVVAITALTDRQTEAEKAGFDGYIVKPFLAETFKRVLSPILLSAQPSYFALGQGQAQPAGEAHRSAADSLAQALGPLSLQPLPPKYKWQRLAPLELEWSRF